MQKILIVDDSDVIRTELRNFLVKEAYEVIEGTSGTEGHQLALEKGPFDLVITDYNMPGMNGIEMCHQIRQDPRFAKTPMIVLTTESSTEIRKKGQEVGIRAWLIKPIDTEAMKKILNKLFTAKAA
jgi:two-component system chemotaxis response regulator CheY